MAGHTDNCLTIPSGPSKGFWICDYRCPFYTWHDEPAFTCLGCTVESGLPVDHETWCDKS